MTISLNQLSHCNVKRSASTKRKGEKENKVDKQQGLQMRKMRET